MKKIFNNDIVLVILSGLLLIPGWYEWGTGLTLLIAFVPLLVIIERAYERKQSTRSVYMLALLAFIIWNIGDTWWIRYALVDGKPSLVGVASAVLISSFLMSTAVWLTYLTRTAFGRLPSYIGFIVFWIACEFAYTHGEIAWPWLTLGNGFAYEVKLIQWYEYTGTMGGSLWVLVSNVLIYTTLFGQGNNPGFNLKSAIPGFLVILVPVVISLAIFKTYTEKKDPVNVVVVQPNIDPYLKFNDIPAIEQTTIQVNLAREFADSTTDYIITPETSIMNNIWLGRFDEVPDLKMVKSFQEELPQLKYIAGIMCYQLYKPGEKLSATANPYQRDGSYYDSYNSAIQIDSTDSIQIYHKSKLVVGVEKMPYPGLLKILKPITLKLGGTFRSHNTQKERTAFYAPGEDLRVGVPICYESVFGEFVGEFVQKGADLIFVITNDGWWDNTPGHRQHNSLSSIRAIETRRSIARSANTGISSIINQKGEVIQSLGWWKRGALKGTINANDKITFYVKHGDYIGRISFFTALIVILTLFVRRMKSKYKSRI